MTTGLGWVFELAIGAKVVMVGGARVYVRGIWVLDHRLQS